MRSEKEMMATIFQVAQEIKVVEAIALNGSKVYRKENTDDFQDYDIVYFVQDEKMEELIENRNWLAHFGEILVMQTPMIEEGVLYSYEDRFNFLMLFQDGNRIDLGVCPLSKISTWAKEDPVAEILYDPKNLLKNETLYQKEAYYNIKKPSNQRFQELCNEFWWVSPYVVKGILRTEYFYALDHLEHIQQCFLELLSWQIASQKNYQITLGKNYKYLKKYLSKKEMTEIMNWQKNDSYQDLAAHLCSLQRAFRKLAEKFSQTDSHYQYQEVEAQQVLNYTQEKLKGLV